MGKLLVAIVFTVLLVGVLLYMGNTKVAPAVVTKSTGINTSITGATVNTTTGVATGTAP
jgi:hypothetical protein